MNLNQVVSPARHLPLAAALVILSMASFPPGQQAHPAPAGRSPSAATANSDAVHTPVVSDEESRATLAKLQHELDEERQTLTALQGSLNTEKRKVRALQRRVEEERRRLGILPSHAEPPAYVPPTF